MTHASLFSGIGGPEVAAAMLGWDNAFHCEINPFGKAVLDYWFPESKSYEDITKTDFKPWRGKIDVLTGGFPCQPFSYAGKRGGREDDRYLWPEMLRAISEIRPTWVVGENVAGLTTMVEGGILADLGCYSTLFQEGDNLHGYELEQPYTIERICRDLEGIGYTVQPMLIPAAGVNAPHRRDRVFIIAFDADSDRDDDKADSGEDEGKSGEERIPERNKILKFGESNQLRSSFQGTATDTDRRGSGEIPTQIHTRFPDGYILVGNGSGRDASDTVRSRCKGENESGEGQGGKRMCVWGDSAGYDWKTDGKLLPEHRWERFPIVSPVHRGNDGFPFPVDNLTISFTRWRTESLKAYGNAIVPQVMYRIFQAIETASL